MGDSSKVVLGLILGGMVPPCAIALSTLLFKDKFTKEERDAGPTNVGNAVMYLVCLVVGTVISAVLLGLLKKKVA